MTLTQAQQSHQRNQNVTKQKLTPHGPHALKNPTQLTLTKPPSLTQISQPHGSELPIENFPFTTQNIAQRVHQTLAANATHMIFLRTLKC